MTKLLLIALIAGALGPLCFAQNEKSSDTSAAPAAKEKFYRLDFSVREVEGERIVNSRSYSTILSGSGESSSIRTGAHVPVSTGAGMWQDVNVGVSIDCKHAQENGNLFQLSVRSDISSMVQSNDKGSERPITRNNSWQSDVTLPLRQPTLLFSSDDPATKQKIQLVLTVTPIR